MASARPIIFGAAALGAALTAGPVIAMEPFNWEGAYVGLQGSYSNVEGHWNEDNVPGGLFKHKGSGGGAGILAGYAFRLEDFVLGIEGDINGERVKSGNHLYIEGDDDEFFQKSSVDRLNAMGSLRLKAGLPGELPLVGESLIYGTLGVAFGRWNFNSYFEVSDDFGPIDFVSASNNGQTDWRTALQFGGGVEIPIADQLSFKFEVIQTDYERQLVTFYWIVDDATPGHIHMDESVTSARIGMNWRF